MLKQLRFAAVPLFAGATIVLTTAPVWAFSQQTLLPNGNYTFDYGALDDKAKLNESPNKSDSDSSRFHFNIESGQTGPFGFRSLGDRNNAAPPDYYQPHGGN